MSAYNALGIAHSLNTEWRAAAATHEQALQLARETRAGLALEAEILANLARAYLGLGDVNRARTTVEEAVVVARRRSTRIFECVAHQTLADVLLQTEGAAARRAIEMALGEAVRCVEDTEAKSFEPFIRLRRAELARLLGDDASSQRERRLAHRLFTEMGATGHAERLAKELGL